MSSKEDSLITRVHTSFEQLSAAAGTLNAVSDQLGKLVSRLDSSFQRLNIGVTGWVKFKDSSSQDGLRFWQDSVGYAKINGRWGLAIRSVAGHEHMDEYISDEEWPFNDAPRKLRVDAVEKLPELFETLSAEAAAITTAVGEKLKLVEEFAAAVDDVVKKRRTTVGEMMGSLSRKK